MRGFSTLEIVSSAHVHHKEFQIDGISLGQTLHFAEEGALASW